jgi:hypothetical protein
MNEPKFYILVDPDTKTALTHLISEQNLLEVWPEEIDLNNLPPAVKRFKTMTLEESVEHDKNFILQENEELIVNYEYDSANDHICHVHSKKTLSVDEHAEKKITRLKNLIDYHTHELTSANNVINGTNHKSKKEIHKKHHHRTKRFIKHIKKILLKSNTEIVKVDFDTLPHPIKPIYHAPEDVWLDHGFKTHWLQVKSKD